MRHQNRISGVIVSLALISILLFPAQGYAASTISQIPLKHRFIGEIFVDGAHPTTGKVVSAWVNGVKYAEVTSGSTSGQNVWDYIIDVPGDDPSTVPIEGGKTAETVQFKIAGFNATPTALFFVGGFSTINLSVTLPTRLEGDVNNDGLINSADALLTAKHIVGTTVLTGDSFLAADVNDDTFVNSADLLFIKKFIVGTVTAFPGGTFIP